VSGASQRAAQVLVFTVDLRAWTVNAQPAPWLLGPAVKNGLELNAPA
jgi:hypothetical protein